MSDDIKETNEVELVDPIFDLANRVGRSTMAVIDTMSQRGAVKGEEMSTIGGLRDQCIQLVQMAEAKHSQT